MAKANVCNTFIQVFDSPYCLNYKGGLCFLINEINKVDKNKKSNDKKNEQLGMNCGTAFHRLRKAIMFDFIKKLKLDTCFQCGKKIESIKELSIEHKIPWLDSENPVDLFFDIENIAFSHLKCNTAAARKGTEACINGIKTRSEKRRRKMPGGKSWCYKCKSYLDVKEFSKNLSRWTNLQDMCKTCKKKLR